MKISIFNLIEPNISLKKLSLIKQKILLENQEIN